MTVIPQVSRVAPAPPAGPRKLKYSALGGLIFRIAFRGALLTLLTLGLHRFWMTTRLRRAYWAGIEVDGEPLEYDGKPTELLLGFFVAVVVLAVILGGMNLALVFGGILAGLDLQIAFNASLPLLIPLGYYAQYRARRYLAARTRWRGLRFGMAGGAGRYMLAATGHLLLTIATLGLLYPRMHQRLAKFQQERTFYGTLRFRQDGRWQRMMGPWLWTWGVMVVAVAPVGWQGYAAYQAIQDAANGQGPISPEDNEALGQQILAAMGFFFGALVLSWPLRRWYAARAEAVLMGGLGLGGARFASSLRAGTLMGVDVKGWAVMLFAMTLAVGVFIGIVFAAAASLGKVDEEMFENIFGLLLQAETASFAVAVIGGYVAIIILFFSIGQITGVHWPLRARIEALHVEGVETLSEARQRERDDAAEAGGFADALDVGAGF